MSALLTRQDVAKRIGVSTTTIYRWEKNNISPVVPTRIRRTNELRYTEEDVKKLQAFKDEAVPAVIGRRS
jgi:DNA-binding XRE family transcriptional regulator